MPIIGDDIKSQVGATITHRVLTNLFRERGVRLDHTYQLNFGGNSDFMNMLERERLESKKISKTNAVTSQLDYPMSNDDAHVGPSDYVPWLKDRKFAYIRMEGTTFGNVPLSCELKLEVWDSPNSAGVVIDAIRLIRLAQDRGIGGPLIGPSSYLMKTPPQQFTDAEAHERTEAFIRGEAEESRNPKRQEAGTSAVAKSRGFQRMKITIFGLSDQARPGATVTPRYGAALMPGTDRAQGHEVVFLRARCPLLRRASRCCRKLPGPARLVLFMRDWDVHRRA